MSQLLLCLTIVPKLWIFLYPDSLIGQNVLNLPSDWLPDRLCCCKQDSDLISDVGGAKEAASLNTNNISISSQHVYIPKCRDSFLLIRSFTVKNSSKLLLTWRRVFWVVLMESCKQLFPRCRAPDPEILSKNINNFPTLQHWGENTQRSQSTGNLTDSRK